MPSMNDNAMVDEILVDARALQDANYRFRGVGQHSTSVLSALRHHAWPGRSPRLIALTDHRAAPLYAEHVRLFDDITTVPQRRSSRRSWLLSLSPMTHDPVWLSALLLDPATFKVALFYDLIPLEIPHRYLRDLGSRADYLVCFAWLGRYDAFAAISEHTRLNLLRARGIDEAKVFVTGVAVRPSLEPSPDEQPLARTDRTHILVPGGGDSRKNPECALLAHARSSVARERGLFLKVFGSYPAASRSDLRSAYAGAGGRQADLVFLPHLTDDDMREAYRSAILTVVPSRAEGFSIPIVESAAAGTPALVSDVGAHPELVGDADLRFPPDQPEVLRDAMERLILREDRWTAARDAAASIWPGYTEEAVGTRFLNALLPMVRDRPAAPAVSRHARPRIAVLTPLPPAASGVADYSAVTLKALSRYANLDVFTDTPGAAAEPHYDSLASVRDAAFSARRFDATLSVLGNSDHHLGIFHFLLDHGGAALAHDARMLGFYKYLLGDERALAVARRETQSEVTIDQLSHWVRHEFDLPTLFLSEIAACADPILVHSAVTADLIKRHYGKSATSLPFAQYRKFDLSASVRHESRKALGWDDDEIVICSFGYVAPDKAADIMIWAVKLLRSWGIRARLVLCGAVDPNYSAKVHGLIEELGLVQYVTTFDSVTPEEIYNACLCGADGAIQLRTYFMGGLSGALNDCIAAGLPTVANAHLADAMNAPTFVHRVPDNLSPVLTAEAILAILNTSGQRQQVIQEASSFAEAHSPDVYARATMAALGFSVGRSVSGI